MQVYKVVLTSAVIIGLLAVLLHQFSSEIVITFVPMATTAIKSIWTVSAKVQEMVQGIIVSSSDADLNNNKPTGKTSKTKDKRGFKPRPKERLFTAEELKRYDGHPESKGLYLAVLGLVFNVKKGKDHYGPGGGYQFFAGRDASRAFVSGDFTEKGLIDDISGLTHTDYIGLDDWVQFYQKDYKYVGKLIGRHFDQKGQPTSYSHETQKWISKAYQQKEDESQEKKVFPPCNSEWTAETGSRLWCTLHSGGVDREWTGVPRKLYTPGHSKPRCACVKNFGPPSHDPTKKGHNDRGDLDNPNLEEYQGCHPEETSCFLTDN